MNKHEYKPYGELEYCHKCMGLEGCMPTDCPEVVMTEEQSDAVYRGNLDFREGRGWVHELSPMGESIIRSALYRMLNPLADPPKSESEIILRVGCTRAQFNEVKKQVVKHLYERPVRH